MSTSLGWFSVLREIFQILAQAKVFQSQFFTIGIDELKKELSSFYCFE